MHASTNAYIYIYIYISGKFGVSLLPSLLGKFIHGSKAFILIDFFFGILHELFL